MYGYHNSYAQQCTADLQPSVGLGTKYALSWSAGASQVGDVQQQQQQAW